MIYRRGEGAAMSKLQNRILVPMSVFDIIGSIGWAFSDTLIPRGSSCTYGAIGNKATCTTQGIMLSLGLCVPMYNCMLSLHYLVVIKHNMQGTVITRYECCMHACAVLPVLTGCIIAASADLINSYGMVCWLAERDVFGEMHDSNPTSNAIYLVLYFANMTFGLVIVVTIAFCMTNIYLIVRKQEEQLLRAHRFQSSRVEDTRNSYESRLTGAVLEAKKQATLYVGSFVLTFSFNLSLLVYVAVSGTLSSSGYPYAILILQGIFSPLQGFWNFLAYIRPKYNIINSQQQYRGKGMFRKLLITIFYKPEDNEESRNRNESSMSGSLELPSPTNRPLPIRTTTATALETIDTIV